MTSISQHDIGLVGLAVMGQNLVMNMANHGYSVGVFNRTTETTDAFLSRLKDLPEDVASPDSVNFISGYRTLAELVGHLKSPRKVMLMVKAGDPVDVVIQQLIPQLDQGDIIIDGGNSHFLDTIRRTKEVEDAGLVFVGTGVSGGEEGALKGPSIMPGGSTTAWESVKELFQSMSAKVGEKGEVPCCEWIGPDGAGHYVKMIHNGIEYGDMQLICEAYFLLKHVLKMENDELAKTFAEWNQGELESYLIEITRDIFTVRDEETGEFLIDHILDTAGQKGTGRWTCQHALDLGTPTSLITEAVYARCLSAQKELRQTAGNLLVGPTEQFEGNREQFVEDIRQALYLSKLCSYAQGFSQLAEAAKEFGWDLDYGQIALLWRGGCIIRSRFLEDIKKAYDRNSQLENLLLDEFFRNAISKSQPSWRRVVATAVRFGLPTPAFSAALSYYDGLRHERLPANLLQAQRDYFGAHRYRRIDKNKDETFHTDWIRKRKEI